MAHSHSQMLGTPFVPPSVTTRLNCMKEVFERLGKCSLCEFQSKDILVSETHNFSAIVPFAASYPFEIWIIPRQHSSYFHEIDKDTVCTVPNSFLCAIIILCLVVHTTVSFTSLCDSQFVYFFLLCLYHITLLCMWFTICYSLLK